ncbi:MAG: hypothetical protein A2297_08045 [Elusimicrobia bacterium RIFOXYB2_FULL_48_7]|nr:MAG: hypothetical protein A2297_08045 [Elusimicrobia bacterium RIFOXYB2_FULL_48_7]
MRSKELKYIYGPINSWRIGASLGIDPVVCESKTCSFDCIYCQIGKTKRLTIDREEFVPVSEVMDEINTLPEINIDYITFAGTGEPTLANNLDKMILAVKTIRKEEIAVITNSSTIHIKAVRDTLCLADFVLAKLDACSESSLKEINSPAHGITIKDIINGLIDFRAEYSEKLAIQIMFIKENRDLAKDLADIVNTIKPDEVQINTPLRPCAVAPLKQAEILAIRDEFIKACSPNGITVKSVYDPMVKKEVTAISSAETMRRRGKPG